MADDKRKFLDEQGLAVTVSKVKSLLDNKVDKVNGKQLSTNDYTTTEKNKLAGIANNANNYSLPKASSTVLGGIKIGNNLTIDSNGVVSATDTNTTYSNMVGATSTSDGSSGLVPKPTQGNQSKFLRADGTWQTPTNTTYTVATTSKDGLMSKTDKSKLDGIAENANNYVHPSTHAASMITQDSTHRFVTDVEKSTWNGKASTAVVTTEANGLMSSDMLTKLNSLNNYTLPTASSTLGGVKTTSTVTSNTGYTASPIIDGVVYYKDTNTTYGNASTTTNGLMTKEMVTKLNGIETGAQVNTVTGVKGSSESTYRTGQINITKTNIGLGNVENKTSATIRGELTSSNVTTALGYTPLNSNVKGSANGVAELDENGLVVASQLPSYVDDVIEGYLSGGKFYKEAAHTTEITGEAGKIYVDLSNNKTYRWSGTAFAEISASLALGETSSTAYRGDRGKVAYDHANAKGSAFTNGLYKITTNAQGHVTSATAVAKSDITALGIPGSDTTYAVATTSANGLMSSAMVTKLNGIANNANNYTHPTTAGNKHIPAGGAAGQILRWSADGTAVWGSDNNTTYSTFTGATAEVNGSTGLVPAPTKGNQSKYLRADGTWQTPPDTKALGSMTGTLTIGHGGTGATDAATARTNLGIGAIGTKDSLTYSDVGLGAAVTNITRSGTTFTMTKADGSTATFTQQDNNTTYSDMKGATSSAAGTHGLVPAPAAGKQLSFLRGDGTWVVPTNTTYGVATTSANGLMSSAMVTKLNGIATGAQVNTITGVKGSAETNYRTGNINITPANLGLGSAIISGSQTTTSTADGGSNVYTFTDVAGNTSTITVKNGSKGSTGTQGNQGPKGDTGPQGPAGTTPTIKTASGTNINTVGTPSVTASTSGTTTTFTFNNLKGATGATGTRGSRWSTGTACTGNSTTGTIFATGITDALVNDMYLNTSTGFVYRCTTAGNASTAKWTYVGSIKGATGSQGAKGNTGHAAGFGTPTASVDANVGTPSVTVTASGANTAKVFNFAFKNLKGATGSQGPAGAKGDTGPQGPKGTNGTNGTSAAWFTGTTVTGTSTTATSFTVSGSKAGDMYLNTSTQNVYRASAANSWIYVCNIKGATGSQGGTGAAAGFGTPTATVDANTGTPSVTITTSGSNTAKVFNFAFKNLKGAKGDNGTNATTTAVATTSANGLLPKLAGGTTKFLRADGTWNAVSCCTTQATSLTCTLPDNL